MCFFICNTINQRIQKRPAYPGNYYSCCIFSVQFENAQLFFHEKDSTKHKKIGAAHLTIETTKFRTIQSVVWGSFISIPYPAA